MRLCCYLLFVIWQVEVEAVLVPISYNNLLLLGTFKKLFSRNVITFVFFVILEVCDSGTTVQCGNECRKETLLKAFKKNEII